MRQKKVIMYAEGAFDEASGRGGYCATLVYNVQGRVYRKTVSESEEGTSRIRMFLTAIYTGLTMIKEQVLCDVYTSSAFIYSAVTGGWMDEWKANDWKKANGDDVENADLWEKISELAPQYSLYVKKLPKESDDEDFNACKGYARFKAYRSVDADE
ncbi:MAG: hypothetical protein LUD47_04540 [Clostridia bacterium]|nr:hypothetical protein [Clostridia bacterium]